MTKFNYVRHGQTMVNAEGCVQDGLIVEEPLNDVGIGQAQETRDMLKDTEIELIFSSPLKRAVQTAEIINEYHNAPLLTDERLIERRAGELSGKHQTDEVDAAWNSLYDFDVEPTVSNAEDITDFFTRVYEFITEIRQKYPDKEILIVGHGGIFHAFNAYFSELEWKGNLRVRKMKNAELIKFNDENLGIVDMGSEATK